MNAGNVTQVFANVDNDAAAEFQLNILDVGVLAVDVQGGGLLPLNDRGLPGRAAGAQKTGMPGRVLGIV